MSNKHTVVMVHVPTGSEEAFFKVYEEFVNALRIKSEKPPRKLMEMYFSPPPDEDRYQLEQRGVESLKVLLRIAQGEARHARYIACFLAGLYNGDLFAFNLNDLRWLDESLYAHVIAVLHMDCRLRKQDVPHYFDNGEVLWATMVARWGIKDVLTHRSPPRKG
ncbi:hypothetical protein AVMA1855_22570 [Acidovorax sp. SUPP1855]|uniref:DUF7673 family protein n=1 Tax=Acidovorax sp. SUPP1855 TaxID=431774 RepID=UPI0023DE4882|nr:hypothetical protein [Acidovorax sp. SUPP1855]GKS86988.1 hypothetical protein AVMA1855_22570 [Acidovorax sp. SUPP1855]